MSIVIERGQSKMKLRSIFTSLALVFLLAPLGMIGQREVQAAEVPKEITFVLHKRMYIDGETEISLKPNSGLEVEEGELADPTKTYGQNDVVFEVYDATDYVEKLLINYSQEEVAKIFLDAKPESLRKRLTEDNLLAEITTKQVNGQNGIASVTLDFSKMGAENTALLFLQKENTPPSNLIREMAAPMLVRLPIVNPTNEKEFLSTVHLYPKGVVRGLLPETGGEEPKPTPTPTPTPKPTPKPSGGLPKTGGLPQTGEAKTMMGLVGFLTVGSVIVLWTKRRTKKEEH